VAEVERPKPGGGAFQEAPERPERRWNTPLIVFSLACGVLVAAGGVGVTVVTWIVTAMLLYGLLRLGWWAVRGVFR
jgi:hypothetical protein